MPAVLCHKLVLKSEGYWPFDRLKCTLTYVQSPFSFFLLENSDWQRSIVLQAAIALGGCSAKD